MNDFSFSGEIFPMQLFIEDLFQFQWNISYALIYWRLISVSVKYFLCYMISVKYISAVITPIAWIVMHHGSQPAGVTTILAFLQSLGKPYETEHEKSRMERNLMEQC